MEENALRETDSPSGGTLKKILIFALPYIILNILQNLFQTTDIAVLGIMVDESAVAAVGATSSLNNLLINFFIGLSVGIQSILARHIAAKKMNDARRTVGAAIFFALFTGIVILFAAYPFIEDILRIMRCDPEVVPLATKYLRIYFLSMPIMMLYNFSAAILNDNGRLIYCLVIGCLVNVGLDVFLVWLGYGVQGVAVASLLSQFVSAILIIIELIKNQGYQGFRLRYFKPNFKYLKEILSIGIPVALRSLIFSLSNVIIQVNVNKFGAVGMSASTSAAQFDAIIYDVGNAIAMATMIVLGEGMAQKDMRRVRQAIVVGALTAFILPMILGVTFTIFAPQLCGFIVDDPEVLELATTRLSLMALTYFMCAVMEVLSYSVQAMGKSAQSLVISIVGECVFRIVFLEIALYFSPSFQTVFLAYPVSWLLTMLAYLFTVPEVYRWIKGKIETDKDADEIIEEIQEEIDERIMEH